MKPEEIRGGCCYVPMAPFQCENQQPGMNVTVLGREANLKGRRLWGGNRRAIRRSPWGEVGRYAPFRSGQHHTFTPASPTEKKKNTIQKTACSQRRQQQLLPFTGVGEAHEGQVVAGEGGVGGGRHGLLEEAGGKNIT